MFYTFNKTITNFDKLHKQVNEAFAGFEGLTQIQAGELRVHFANALSETDESALSAMVADFVDYTGTELLEKELLRPIEESQAIANDIIQKFKAANLVYFLSNNVSNEMALMHSLWVHHRLRAATVTIGGVTFTIDIMNLVISGDLETALVVMQALPPDDMTMPYHYLTQDRINSIVALLAGGLGL